MRIQANIVQIPDNMLRASIFSSMAINIKQVHVAGVNLLLLKFKLVPGSTTFWRYPVHLTVKLMQQSMLQPSHTHSREHASHTPCCK